MREFNEQEIQQIIQSEGLEGLSRLYYNMPFGIGTVWDKEIFNLRREDALFVRKYMEARRDEMLEMLCLESLAQESHPLFRNEAPVERFKRKQDTYSQIFGWSNHLARELGCFREDLSPKRLRRRLTAEYILQDNLLDLFGVAAMMIALRKNELIHAADGEWDNEVLAVFRWRNQAFNAMLYKTIEMLRDPSLKSQNLSSLCRLVSEAVDPITNNNIIAMLDWHRSDDPYVQGYLNYVKEKTANRHRNFLGQWYEKKDMRGVGLRNAAIAGAAATNFILSGMTIVVFGLNIIHSIFPISPLINAPFISQDLNYIEIGLCGIGTYLSTVSLLDTTRSIENKKYNYNKYMEKNDPLINRLLRESRIPTLRDYETATKREYR